MEIKGGRSYMITLHRALEYFKEISFTMPMEEVLLEDSIHRVLSEDIFSDLNMPPFDKSAMDGYACRVKDLNENLKVIGTLYAGSKENYLVTPGTCVKIMTGAPVPEGADMVIKIEDTGNKGNDTIRPIKASAKSNICKLGEDIKKGDLVLRKGTYLLPHHISVLASVGKSRVKVFKQPKIALLSTGSELVEPHLMPEKGQIRNSSAYCLLAQLQTMNLKGDFRGIIPDDKEKILQVVSELLKTHDILIITGGASIGEHDFVPHVFKELKLDILFSELAIQPGKPVNFAVRNDKFCFGLSGNPVSSLVQFEVLVKPFIYHIMQHGYSPKVILGELADDISRKKADRLLFFPVRFNSSGLAEEIKFNGSAHIAGLTNADGFGLFPQKCYALNAGEKIEILLLP